MYYCKCILRGFHDASEWYYRSKTTLWAEKRANFFYYTFRYGLCIEWVTSNQIKSDQIYFSIAEYNNTQYKSIDLKYEIPLLKEWMVRQADTNTIPNLGL